MKPAATATTSQTLASSLLALIVMSLGATAAAGCAPVRNFERERLAHPTMAASDLTGIAEAHIRGTNEGAAGGSGGTGSGCGCN
jgi:hypothetical protein